MGETMYSMRFLCTLTVLGFILITSAAHSQRRGHPTSVLSVIDDIKVLAFVTLEGKRILHVTKNRDKSNEYRFYLADLGGQHAGLSAGNHIIYILYKAARTAYLNRKEHRSLLYLRVILAHEIAHDVLRHSKYRSSAKELAADRLGIILWKRLGWDCSFWVQFYETRQKRGITLEKYPTDLHLLQAQNLCPEAEEHKRREAKERQIQAEQRRRAIQIKRAEERKRTEELRRAEERKRAEELRRAEEYKREAMKEELRELKLLEQQLKLQSRPDSK